MPGGAHLSCLLDVNPRKRQETLKFCYEKELSKDPKAEGTLITSWIISGTGDPASVKAVVNTLGASSAQPVEACVIRILERLKFPASAAGQALVTYPFSFSSSGGAAPDNQAPERKGASIGELSGDHGGVQDARAQAKARALAEARTRAAGGNATPGPAKARADIGVPVVVGGLDTEIIRRIVQQHTAQVRYCYEKELVRTPGIMGEIVVKWVINGEGKVDRVRTAETQMKNSNVENCVTTEIKTWVFPNPKGGGIVIVTQPFTFNLGG